MCGGGGAGGSGTQKYEWNDVLGPHWEDTILGSRDVANQAFESYSQNRGRSKVAGLSDPQFEAGNYFTNMNRFTADPTRSMNAAMGSTIDTLGDSYLSGAKASPYNRDNKYQGLDNPYFTPVVQQGLSEITHNYNLGTSPETTRLFNMSGAFGGSAHQNAIANNQAALAKQLSDYSYKMWNDQYNRSAMMDESALDRGAGTWNAERGRQMQAIGAGQNEGDLALRRGSALMSYGDLIRSIDQGYRDEDYGDWFTERNQGKNNLSWLAGMLGAAQGGITPQVTQPGASTGSQLLGAGLLAASLFR